MSKLFAARIYRWTRAKLTLSFLASIGCLCLLALLGWLSQEVLERESFSFDTTILWWLHRHSNATIDAVMTNITTLGNPEFVVPLVVVSFGLLIWLRRFWTAQILFLTCLGALMLNQGLKLVFCQA